MIRISARVGVVVAAMLTGSVCPARGQDDVAQVLMDLQRQEEEAEMAKDLAAMDRIFADDAIVTREDGTVLGKTQFLEATGAVPAGAYTSFEYADVVAHRYGDAAVVSYRATFDRISEYRVTVVWILQQGAWRTAAVHYSLLS